MNIVGDDGSTGDEFTPPQTFARTFMEWMAFDETGINAEDLPKMTTWHVLIMPKQPKKMTAGGIALPVQVQQVEAHLNYIGQVVALGPLAGKNEKFKNPDWDDWSCGIGNFRISDEAQSFPEPPRYLWDVKVGDWVIYGRHAGMHKEFRNIRFLTVNDDDITDVIKSPDGFRVYG